MALRIPKITIQADFEDDGSAGEISSACVGYGLHQAWIYATMFGSATLFGIENIPNGTSFSSVYLISLIVNFIILIVCGVADSRMKGRILRLSERKSTVAGPALLMSAGTFLIMLCDASSPTGVPISIAAGVMTGTGSALFLLCWGDVFARMNLVSIIFNTILTFAFATVVYVVLLLLPAPLGGIVAALLPWAEMALVHVHSGSHYYGKRDIPPFVPLPVNRVRFYAAFSMPMLFFGVALGYMREISMSDAMLVLGTGGQVTGIVVAEIIAALVLAIGLWAMRDEHINDFVRPVLPLIGLSLACTIFIGFGDVVPGVIVLAGYISFEGMLWVMFCEYSQRYRLSPVLVFGIGRGALGIGSFVGLFMNAALGGAGGALSQLDAVFVVLAFVCLLAGQSLVLHRRDIQRIMLHGDIDRDAVADMLNLGEAEDEAGDTTEAVLEPPSDQAAEAQATEVQAAEGADSSPVGAVQAAAPVGAVQAARVPEVVQTVPATGAEAGRRAASAVPEKRVVPSDSSATDEQSPNAERTGFFRKKCEVVANRYLLSAREAEVLFYLAKGYNSAYIQEKLYIAEGTAKTHIRHIYSKVDVHSQQELMRLVNEIHV